MKRGFKLRRLAPLTPLTLSALLALSAIAAVGPLAAPQPALCPDGFRALFFPGRIQRLECLL